MKIILIHETIPKSKNQERGSVGGCGNIRVKWKAGVATGHEKAPKAWQAVNKNVQVQDSGVMVNGVTAVNLPIYLKLTCARKGGKREVWIAILQQALQQSV